MSSILREVLLRYCRGSSVQSCGIMTAMIQNNWHTVEVRGYSGYKRDQHPHRFIDPRLQTEVTIHTVESTWIKQDNKTNQRWTHFIVTLESGEKYHLRLCWSNYDWEILLEDRT